MLEAVARQLLAKTLLHLLGISNQSSSHQCCMECMFSFKNGPGIETISNASEFVRHTLNIWDNDCALAYLSEEGWLLFDGFITESMNFCGYSLSIRSSYILNFLVEIILILTYDLGSTDQTMNDSPFQVMWVVGLEV